VSYGHLSHSGRPQTCRFPTFGRAASGGALAPEPPRATRSQPEFMRTRISPKTLFPPEKSCWAWRKLVWVLKYVYPVILLIVQYPPGSTQFDPMGSTRIVHWFNPNCLKNKVFWEKIRMDSGSRRVARGEPALAGNESTITKITGYTYFILTKSQASPE